ERCEAARGSAVVASTLRGVPVPVITAGLARPGWIFLAGLSWRVVVGRVPGWRARRAVVAAGRAVLRAPGRGAGRAGVVVLHAVVHVCRCRARRALLVLVGSLVLVLILALVSGFRGLLMAVGVSRRDVPCIRAGLSPCGVIAMAECASRRDVL